MILKVTGSSPVTRPNFNLITGMIYLFGTYITEKNITTDEVVECLKDYEKNQEFPIINCCGDPLVSMDYLASPYSAIVDTRWLDVVDSNLLKVVLWYDNEYGYSLNLLRQVSYILSFLNGESLRSIV